ncbi:FimV/HubP family polar landmark protein [Gilvimarinus sp. DA14]|uniref:FimV/HubP family polar landmark protein n=1 Tax=Gilvimarinus sp. DA14 TaxID=2956798 RepID=UPI0020B81883|nr:FimV/HubP family polar landmark protein [Gilvimarinus sp. DA14]UTF60988.1 LysM peptidoglycan-binding domain-containing protein [Gilvimarinus sp. DA14]
MHFRKLVLLLGVLSLVISRAAFGLGLGDITLNSSLNQPLDAHIALDDLGELGPDQIIVQLGSQEDFDRAGIERSFFYSQLRFNVITDQGDDAFIAVSSRDPVREPFLSFIVDVRWTSGRVLREYTLLLDLPTFSDDPSAPVQATVTPISSQTTELKSEPVRQTQDSAAVSAQRSGGGESQYSVKPNDTLWEIARDNRPGGVSIQQAMLGIQRANPEAFINNNINLLRQGQVLRIPGTDEIRSLSNRQAISQVAQQNRDWSGEAMGAPLDASGRSADNERDSGSVTGRVKLAAPGTTADSGSAQGGGYGESDSGALAAELAAAEEELERTQGENSELRSRVGDLEEQIETMERLLEVSNEQLRALELAAQSNSATESEAEQSATDTMVSDTETPADSETGTATEPDVGENEAVAEAEPEPAVEEPPARQANTVVRRAPEPSLMDKIMANILWIGLALIALIVALFVALRKRSGSEEEVEEFTSEVDDSVFTEQETEQVDEEPTTDIDGDEEFALESEETAEPETGDVVSEADIYIAYGKYDQAEEMLKKGLAKEPESNAIKLKLLEVYAESENLEDFDHYYGQVLASGDAAEIDRAQDLRAQFVGAPDYVAAGSVAAAGAVMAEAGSELLSDSQDEPDAASEDELEIAAETPEDEEFSFDLDSSDELTLDDLDIDSEVESRESTDESDELVLDDDFDFDLDSDDEQDKPATEELELQGSQTSYDLSFDDREETTADSDLSDFDFELDDGQQDLSSAPDAVAPESDDDADVAASSESVEETFELELDDIDIDDSGAQEDDSAEVSLADEKPLLDEDFDFSLDESLPEEDEPAPEYSEVEAYDPASESRAPQLDDEEVPTLELADDEDDFDLEQPMEDLDLEALDREMSDLDAPEPLATEETENAADDSSADDASVFEADESLSFDVEDDDAFEQALGDVSEPEADVNEGEEDSLDIDELPTPESVNEVADEDDDLDFLADADEVATKLDLARAYIDMGDMDGARDILAEVVSEGNEAQQSEAQSLMDKVDS